MNSHHPAFCSKLLQKPEICKQPPSSVIHRLASFLPQLKASNVELDEQLQTSPDEVNIENVKTDDLVVEMNIAVIEREGSLDSSTDASSDEESDDSDDSLDHTRSADAAFSESSSPSSVDRLPKLKLTKVCTKNKCKPSIEILSCVESSNPAV